MRRRCWLILLVVTALAGCEIKPPAGQPAAAPGPSSSTAVPQPPVRIDAFDSKRSFSGMMVLLIPVPLAEGQERCQPEDVPGRLFPGMAADETSLALLTRLYDGHKVELYPHTDAEKKPEATIPPQAGFTVSIRGNVYIAGPDEDETTKDGRRSGYFAAAIFVRVPAESVQAGPIAGRFDALPDDVVALRLACNDYLLRKLPGWTLVDGRGANDIYSYEAPTTSPEEQRVELDGKIAEYLQRFQPAEK